LPPEACYYWTPFKGAYRRCRSPAALCGRSSRLCPTTAGAQIMPRGAQEQSEAPSRSPTASSSTPESCETTNSSEISTEPRLTDVPQQTQKPSHQGKPKPICRCVTHAVHPAGRHAVSVQSPILPRALSHQISCIAEGGPPLAWRLGRHLQV